MTSRLTAVLVGMGLCVSGLTLAGTSRAADPTKQACADANTKAQTLRASGKFAASRASLKSCIVAACPAVIRADCAERLDALDAAQPSLVVEAKDASGADLANVAVFVDGTKITDKVGGEALPMDPGEHDLRFETPGADPVSHHLIVREGDRGRHEAVIFKSLGQPSAPPPVTPATTTATTTSTIDTPPAPSPPGAAQRRAGIGVAVGGGALVIVGGVFGLLANAKWNDAKDNCSSGGADSCTTANRKTAVSDRSDAVTRATVSDVGFIAGGVLVAGGLVLVFTAPHAGTESAPSVSFTPSVTPGGGGGMLRGTF